MLVKGSWARSKNLRACCLAVALSLTAALCSGCARPDFYESTQPRSIGPGNSIVFMGDSHTGRGSIPRVGEPGSVEIGGLVGMILAQVPSVRYGFNAGVGSEDTREMIKRWESDVVALNPQVVHLLGGTNDITGGLTHDTTIQNLRWMIRESRTLGAVVFIGTIPPRDRDPASLDNIERLNSAIKSLAAEEGTHLIDYHSSLVHPGTGNFKRELTDDGVHANTAGNKVMATVAAAVMQRVLPGVTVPLADSSNSATPSPLLHDCCFASERSPAGVPEGWAVAGTAQESSLGVTVDPGFVGQAMRIDFNNADNLTVTTTIDAHRWAVGDRVAFAGKYRANGVETGRAAFTISLEFSESKTKNYKRLRPVNQANNVDTIGIGYFYIEGDIPAGTETLNIQVNAIRGSGDLELGQLTLWTLEVHGTSA